MLNKLRFDFGDMAIALAVWFCTLPIIGFIAIPLVGRRQALLVALTTFLAIMAICWGICGVKKYKAFHSNSKNIPSLENSAINTQTKNRS